MSSNIRLQRICEHCGDNFTAKTTVTRFCSDRCAKRAYKARKRKEKIKESKTETKKKQLEPIEILKAKEYLSIKEVSKLIGVSRRSVYRLIEQGEIRKNKIGSRTIIKRSEVDKLFIS